MRPCFFASCIISSYSTGQSLKSTVIIVLVLLVIREEIDVGDILYVLGSISAKTGLPPQYKMQFELAAKVIGVVITSSLLLILAAKQAACNAAVPFENATAYLAPTYRATACSK